MGDVTGDGVADLIVGAGKGGNNRLRVYDLARHRVMVPPVQLDGSTDAGRGSVGDQRV